MPIYDSYRPDGVRHGYIDVTGLQAQELRRNGWTVYWLMLPTDRARLLVDVITEVAATGRKV